jgi:hypothetical protein
MVSKTGSSGVLLNAIVVCNRVDGGKMCILQSFSFVLGKFYAQKRASKAALFTLLIAVQLPA